MLELAAAKHCEGFMSLSHLAGANGGEQARVPIDLASLASGLVSTDGKVANAKTGPTKLPSSGRPWATLSEYLQQHLPAAGDFDKLVPHSEPSTGRLEPHKEAINKGWHFGNVSSPEVAPATLLSPLLPPFWQFESWMLDPSAAHVIYAVLPDALCSCR